jgi:fatty acyl-CoA reductase
VRLHSKVNRSLNQLEKFIFSEWKFYNPKALRLAAQLNEDDKQMFYLDMSTMEWEPYFHDLCIGVRTYLNKEKLSTLKTARIKDKM